MKIAHISDLHLSKISYDLRQFFSKRWLGNLNILISRKKKHKEKQLWELLKIWKDLEIDALIVTGDITSTSYEKEFLKAKFFFEKVSEICPKIYFLPGNHDHYTKKAHKEKIFYQYFENKKEKKDYPGKEYALKKDHIEIHPLKPHLWLILLDTALATSLLSSRGCFSKTLERNLISALKKIPENDSVIIANHFPFTKESNIRKTLLRKEFLKKIIEKHPNIRLYLQGHTHRQKILDLREQNLPLILDSGSSSHYKIGSWNLIEINEKITVTVYKWEKHHLFMHWKKSPSKIFPLFLQK